MRRYLLVGLFLAAVTPAKAADSTVTAMTASSAFVGTELMYIVQSSADTKGTPAQMATYVYSLMSGSCTVLASVITCTDAGLSTSDITTNNVSTSKHGFTPKLPNDATKYLNGTGAYSVPASGGQSSLGYQAGFWYAPYNLTLITTGSSTNPGSGSIRFFPVYFPTTMTVEALGVRITTASAGGNIQLALYANGTNGRPTGSALASTSSISTTSATSVNGTISYQVTANTWYWLASNADNATVVMESVGVGGTAVAAQAGSSTQGNISGNGAVMTGTSFAQTFGTWPSMTGQTTVDIATNTIPYIVFQVVSVP